MIPDLVLLTGDLVEHRRLRDREVAMAQKLVDRLRARLGIFGIFGNHDGDFLAARMDRAQMRNIENKIVSLESSDALIELIGLPGVNRDDLDEEFFDRIPSRSDRSLRIVLAHYPDQIRRAARIRPDLLLAGHTHGGQICLPGGTPMITHDSLPRKFASGAHRVGQTWLVVSRGIGYAGLPLRIFCASEVPEIVLERA